MCRHRVIAALVHLAGLLAAFCKDQLCGDQTVDLHQATLLKLKISSLSVGYRCYAQWWSSSEKILCGIALEDQSYKTSSVSLIPWYGVDGIPKMVLKFV